MKHNFSKNFKLNLKNTFPRSVSASFPKTKKEESEFGKSKKGITVCKKCNAVLFQGSWRHKSEIKPEKENNFNGFSLCPACEMIKNNKYEGEIIIENIDPEIMEHLINSIKNAGKMGFEKDSQDRIISINGSSKKINVFTTENQLAVKIAKKIKKSFNGTVKIIHSKKESVIRVYITL